MPVAAEVVMAVSELRTNMPFLVACQPAKNLAQTAEWSPNMMTQSCTGVADRRGHWTSGSVLDDPTKHNRLNAVPYRRCFLRGDADNHLSCFDQSKLPSLPKLDRATPPAG
jgi:hypothetical protein